MSRFENIAALLNGTRTGYSLPQQLYVGEQAFEFDTQVMLKSVWLYTCTVAHVKKPGDYYVFELANNSVIIVRGRDNEVRAFYNSCRHRGARICEAQRGASPRLMCPYHQWTYNLDGTLLGARNMGPDFDKTEHGLIPVAVENIAGLIFICMSDNPPPIDRVKKDIAAQISIYDLEKCKVAIEDSLIEDANWKLVMENNRECYHCDANHPELIKCLGNYGFGSGLPGDGDGEADYEALTKAKHAEWDALGIGYDHVEFPDDWWHRVVRLPLLNGTVSQTLDGTPASRVPLGAIAEGESSSVSVWTEPNSWHHFCSDHIVTFSLTPVAANKSLLRTSWLVHEDAEAGVDYDPDKLTAVWRATNRQDSFLANINHLGIATDGYRPGPYALPEKLVGHFKDFYVEKAMVALRCGE
jgi:glycine betaine catabolism A